MSRADVRPASVEIDMERDSIDDGQRIDDL